MSLTIELPKPIEDELAADANRDGEQASLLLLVARSMTREGQATPFGQAVKAVFASQSINADQVVSVVEHLLKLCAGGSEFESDSQTDKMASEGLDIEQARGLLLHWRSLAVHLPTRDPSDRATPTKRATAFGKYAYVPTGSDMFSIEKAMEIENEDRPRG